MDDGRAHPAAIPASVPDEQKQAAAAFERLVVNGGVAQGLQAAAGSQPDNR